MTNLNNKYRNIKYNSLGDVIKKELDDIEDLVQEGVNEHDEFLRKDVHDKDGNNIIDVAETLEGLTAKVEELNALMGIKDNIQKQLDILLARKPRLLKTVHTITAQPNQFEFTFERNLDEIVVEIRNNTTWMHDEDYLVANNTVILRKPFEDEKELDFIFYEAVFSE